MKERKYDIDSEEKKTNMKEKQPYEKPRLGRVTLFADQVMGSCFGLMPCTIIPVRS